MPISLLRDKKGFSPSGSSDGAIWMAQGVMGGGTPRQRVKLCSLSVVQCRREGSPPPDRRAGSQPPGRFNESFIGLSRRSLTDCALQCQRPRGSLSSPTCILSMSSQENLLHSCAAALADHWLATVLTTEAGEEAGGTLNESLLVAASHQHPTGTLLTISPEFPSLVQGPSLVKVA